MKSSLLSVATAVFFAATTVASTSSRAEVEFPWCVITSTGQSGIPCCVYATLQQCQAFLAGQSGFCQPNPRAATQAQLKPSQRAVARGKS